MLFSKKIGTQVAVTLNGSQLAATTFSELPDDVLKEIISKLSAVGNWKCRFVCKKYLEVAKKIDPVTLLLQNNELQETISSCKKLHVKFDPLVLNEISAWVVWLSQQMSSGNKNQVATRFLIYTLAYNLSLFAVPGKKIKWSELMTSRIKQCKGSHKAVEYVKAALRRHLPSTYRI